MKIYVFGNRDHEEDKLSFVVAEKLIDYISNKNSETEIRDLEFEEVKPNQDLPFSDMNKVILMDVVMGIKKVTLITHKHLEKLILPPRNSAHDYDLGFQLKYLMKLGKLKEVYVIGLPMNGDVDYDSIHSILRKLVAQDMQGS